MSVPGSILIPMAEWNRLKKSTLELHILKREMRKRESDQEGGGIQREDMEELTAEVPVAPAIVTSPVTAASSTVSQLSVEELVRLFVSNLSGQAGAGPDDLVTKPPLGSKADLVTLPPLGGAGAPSLPGPTEAAAAAAAVTLAPKAGTADQPRDMLTTESVLRHFGKRKRKVVKVFLDALLSLDKVSLSANGDIEIDGQRYSGEQFRRLIAISIRKSGLGRVKGAEHFFHYVARTGLMVHVHNKNVVASYSVQPPGANGIGRTSAPLTAAEKEILAGKWWRV